MALRHKITINVMDPHVRNDRVIKGVEMRLSERFTRFLFREFTQVYLLAPDQTVDFVDVHELKEGGTTHGKNERTCTV